MHIKRLNTDNEKTSFVYSEQRSMAEREEKSSPFCFTNQASCLDVSRGRKQTTKSGQCHPGYKGKHCETRKYLDCCRKGLLKTKVTENPAGCYLNSNPVRVFLKIQVMLSLINGMIKLKLFPYGSNVRVQGS